MRQKCLSSQQNRLKKFAFSVLRSTLPPVVDVLVTNISHVFRMTMWSITSVKEALSTTCRYDLHWWGLLCEKCGHPHYRVIIKPKCLRLGGHQHLLMAVFAIKKGKRDDMTWATNWDSASGVEVNHHVTIIIWWEDHRINFPNVRSRRVRSFWLLNVQHVRRHRVNHRSNINKVGVRCKKMEKN